MFGSQAYVHVPETKRKKLDSKAKKLTFVGYAMEQKAYRFVDLQTDQITVSRDARFIELDNGTASVDIPTREEQKENEKVAEENEEDIELIPFNEEKEEDYYDAEGLDEGYEDNPNLTLRRSKRSNLGTLPQHLQDYTVGFAACAVEGPVDHREALKDRVWRDAMLEELESHQRNNTWTLVPLPEGRKAIGSKWVYKEKRNEENQVVKHKARLVAQGYAQRSGVDVDDVFAPVTCQATFRTFLSVAAKNGMHVRHLDVKTAYLYGHLEEEVFMRQPPGFVVPGKEHLVCRLQRSIYGLRQSARCWNRRLDEVLLKSGFKAAVADPCLYVGNSGNTKVFLVVYVDDILVASTNESELEKVCSSLEAEFELTSLGEVRHFLGVEVKREGNVFKISLQNYIDKLLKVFGMEQCKTAKSPMDPGYLKLADDGKPFEDPSNYRSLVGGLLYLAIVARPDIAATAGILGRRFSAPRECDWTAAKRVLRYLKATKCYQLQLGGDQQQSLTGYSDADWAGDVGSRRSTSGILFKFGGGCIMWASRRQVCVSLSSMEAEYVALSETCQEALWLRRLLRDLGETQNQPTAIMEDNQGCLAFVRSERVSRRSKHIETKERFIQELCARGEVRLEYCPTDRMQADILTKPLGPVKHLELCKLLGLNMEQSGEERSH